MIILDTHAWIWWILEPRRLSSRARQAIDETDDIGIAAISLLEVADAVRKGKVDLGCHMETWIDATLAVPGVSLLPISSRIADLAANLGPRFPRDPADRLIGATALSRGVPLVTADGTIADSGLVKVVW